MLHLRATYVFRTNFTTKPRPIGSACPINHQRVLFLPIFSLFACDNVVINDAVHAVLR